MLWRRVVRRITWAPSRSSTLSTCLATIVGEIRSALAAAAKLPSSATRTTTCMLSSRSIFHTVSAGSPKRTRLYRDRVAPHDRRMRRPTLCAALFLVSPLAAAETPPFDDLRLYAFDCGRATLRD